MVKTYIADIEKENQNNPCYGCGTGWGSSSSGVDENGTYMETHSCTETCEKLIKNKININ